LEDVDRELGVPHALTHLAGGALDGLGARSLDQAELAIHPGGGDLDQSQRVNEASRHRAAGDGEILDGALRLRAVSRGGGHLHFSHAVLLRTEFRLHIGIVPQGGRISKRLTISALGSSMACTEQYFVSLKRIASATASGRI